MCTEMSPREDGSAAHRLDMQRAGGKKLNQRDSFVYLGGAVCGDGKTESAGRSERMESS